MGIPHSKRVKFQKNPLAEVIFQARFPQLLEIEAELPVNFHTKIRSEFPIFNTSKIVEIRVDPGKEGSGAVDSRQYEMLSTDRTWKVILKSDYFLISSTNYIDWEEFREKSESVISSFLENYNPIFFSRIGHRYRNVISKKRLDLTDTSWRELIQPYISSVFSSDLDDENIKNMRSTFELSLQNDINVRVMHGLIKVDDDPDCYLIDNDFFKTGEIKADGDTIIRALDQFRPIPNDLFQWCITEKLRAAMDPVER